MLSSNKRLLDNHNAFELPIVQKPSRPRRSGNEEEA